MLLLLEIVRGGEIRCVFSGDLAMAWRKSPNPPTAFPKQATLAESAERDRPWSSPQEHRVSNLQLLAKIANLPVPFGSDGDNILVTDASYSRPINAGFDSKDLSGPESRFREARFLVDFQPQAMAGSVKESVPASVPNLGRVAVPTAPGLSARKARF